MGVVLLAVDVALGRKVALKLMRPQYASHPEVAARFQREARATAAVRSDHVVSIFAVAEAETRIGCIPYIAMEYLRGESLEQRLKQGPLTMHEVLDLSRQIATGLAAVHAKSLVHRDIKPGNLWLEKLVSSAAPESSESILRAKLLDFGLAHTGEATTVLTEFGTLLGTPAYMSPEQAAGHEVDARSDLFSLGVVMYEMTTLQQPFRGPNAMAVLMSLGRDVPTQPCVLAPNVPARLSQLILKLLDKEPSRRPATAIDVIQELRAIETELKDARFDSNSSQRSSPTSDTVIHQPRNQVRRSHRWLALVGILLVLAGAASWLNAKRIQVETPQGILVIDTEDEDIRVRITRNGATIFDGTKDRKLQLAVGEYGVELVNKVNGLKLSAEKITITREGQPPIRITREGPVAQTLESPTTTTAANQRSLKTRSTEDPSRRFAAWVQSIEGLVIPPGGGDPIKSVDALPIGAVPNLVSFNMSGTSQKTLTDADVNGFKDFPGVENALYIRLSPLTPSGLMRIGALVKGKRIGQLGLLDMPIGATAFKTPGGFSEIVSLTLQNVQTNDDELVHLKSLSKLNTLNLRFNNITDQGLVHLAVLKTLKHLDLHHTNVTAAGVAKLQAVLPDCQITTSLPPKP
jgi:serine/threonine protein kinase